MSKVSGAFGCKVRSEAFSALFAVFPLRKFYTEQMFVSARMQQRNHVDTQTVKRISVKWAIQYRHIYTVYTRY